MTIKTELQKDNDRINKRIGAVADADTKLIVYILDYDVNIQLNKGQRVKKTGRLIEISSKIHFEVKSSKHIEKIDVGEIVSEDILDKIDKTLKRRNSSSLAQEEINNDEKVSV